jgi:hypothetical protein
VLHAGPEDVGVNDQIGLQSRKFGPVGSVEKLHAADPSRQVKDRLGSGNGLWRLAIVPQVQGARVQIDAELAETSGVSAGEVVGDHDIASLAHEMTHEVAADEPGSAGDTVFTRLASAALGSGRASRAPPLAV